MSHSSGIPVSASLKDAFGKAISGNTRLVKVQIDNEQLVDIASKDKQGDLNKDLSLIPDLLDASKPCYILFKEDQDDIKFLMFCYVPAKSPVKDKMLYASTRSNLKQQLGSNYFSDEVFGDSAKDFSVEGYKLHVDCKKMEAPLTEQEEIRKAELESGEMYSGGASTYVHGVTFPVDNAVVDAVKGLLKGSHNYVQIAIDCDKERIICGATKSLNLAQLKDSIPTDEPRFHLFAFQHSHEGQSITSNVYFFSCPDGSKGTKSAPVRMRMLYSSSKANVAEVVKAAGGNIDAKQEINTGDEIDEAELLLQLHPPPVQQASTFSRPSRPGKGGARLLRTNK